MLIIKKNPSISFIEMCMTCFDDVTVPEGIAAAAMRSGKCRPLQLPSTSILNRGDFTPPPQLWLFVFFYSTVLTRSREKYRTVSSRIFNDRLVNTSLTSAKCRRLQLPSTSIVNRGRFTPPPQLSVYVFFCSGVLTRWKEMYTTVSSRIFNARLVNSSLTSAFR